MCGSRHVNPDLETQDSYLLNAKEVQTMRRCIAVTDIAI